MTSRILTIGTVGLTLTLAGATQAKITLDIDYTYDTNNFFNPSTPNGLAARAALSAAADVFNDRFLDDLAAITPSGSNSWTPSIRHPGTGALFDVPGNPTIAANVIKVYAGGRNEGGSTLGVGGPGGWSANGFTPWFDTLRARGETGAIGSNPTDFGSWGGSITFNNTSNWNFSVTNLPASGQNDFYSVAVHELGHLLGFGLSTSFTQTYTTGLQFTGPKSKALNGGVNVPLANSGHLSGSLVSTVTGSGTQQPLMSPSILVGTRKRLTLLDWAGFDDLGWDLAKPGDANADGTVDFDDLLTLAQNYGLTGNRTWSEGDFNYDWAVNFDDLLALAQNYGTSGPLGLTELPEGASADFAADWALAVSMVPEPASLTAFAGLLLVATRRRK